MRFSDELPGDRMFELFNGLADRCYGYATQHLRAPIGISFIVALALAWALSLPSGNLWWLLAVFPIGLAVWFVGSVVHYWAWSRWRFRRTCEAIRNFEKHYGCSASRMRSLWTLSHEVRGPTGRLLLFDELAERTVQQQFPYLQREPTWESGSTDSNKPAS